MKPITILIAVCFLFAGLEGQAQKKKDKDKEKAVEKPAETVSQPQEQAPAQTQTAPAQSTPANPIGEHFARKYALATRWNDAEAAKDALYDLIADYPGSDSLIFSLAYYYYENQKYPSSVLVCQDLLARNPKSIEVLE